MRDIMWYRKNGKAKEAMTVELQIFLSFVGWALCVAYHTWHFVPLAHHSVNYEEAVRDVPSGWRYDEAKAEVIDKHRKAQDRAYPHTMAALIAFIVIIILNGLSFIL